MIRRPPRSTPKPSSAASDVYKRQHEDSEIATILVGQDGDTGIAEAVLEILEEDYPEMEVDILQGDQPVYHYMMFVE